MRITTGKAKGIKLDTLDGEATRPTAERVKEAIFSMIQFDIEGRSVLDLFAGSGQMGLESLSRGADNAILVDKSSEAIQIIKKNAQKTKLYDMCKILTYNYKDYIKAIAGRAKFNIIFLDPPYAENLLSDALECIIKADIIADQALIVCESDKNQVFQFDKLSVLKQVKYGKSYVTILILNNI